MKRMIGTSLPRPDALAKVTGSACYLADLVQSGMLHLQVVFAHRPHARILSLDTQAALRLPAITPEVMLRALFRHGHIDVR